MNPAPADLAALLPESVPIDRAAGSLDARLDWTRIPAKAAVYLLSGCEESTASPADERALLLATVGDLRAALKRRLDEPHAEGDAQEERPAESPAPAPTKRIPYHRLCTRVQFQIVHSPFAANWVYLRAARMLHPTNYRELLTFHPAWWITVTPSDAFPRLRPVQGISHADALYAGPVRDRASAGRLVDAVEDLFDLCREYPTLQLAPRGRACAYKEMGKCPAPCDGSVGMDWYHRQIALAWVFLADPVARARWLAAQESTMRDAASRLEFERAAKIKTRLTRASLFEGRGAEPLAHVRPLPDFSFLCIEPGRGKRRVELFLVHGGSITALGEAAVKTLAQDVDALWPRLSALADEPVHAPFDDLAIDHAGLLAHHLFRRDPGIYLRTTPVLAEGPDALRDLLARRLADAGPAVALETEAPA